MSVDAISAAVCSLHVAAGRWPYSFCLLFLSVFKILRKVLVLHVHAGAVVTPENGKHSVGEKPMQTAGQPFEHTASLLLLGSLWFEIWRSRHWDLLLLTPALYAAALKK